MSFLDLYEQPTRQVDLTPDLVLAQHQDELKRICRIFFRDNLTTAEHTMRALNAGLQAWREEVKHG